MDKRKLSITALVVIMWFALLILTYYYYDQNRPPPSPLDDPDLIGTEDCQPPCWNGIVPGTTTRQEAAIIINSLNLERVRRDPECLIFSGVNHYLLPHEDNLIQQIDINFHTEPYLYQVIDYFGEPEGFGILPSEDIGYIYILLYPKHGMVLELSDVGYLSNIRSNMTIIRGFFVPATPSGNMEVFIKGFNDSFTHWGFSDRDVEIGNVQPWPGYGKLP